MRKISKSLIQKLRDNNMEVHEATLYLVSLYYDIHTKIDFSPFTTPLEVLGIIKRESQYFVLNIDIFEETEEREDLDWVEKEYCPLFLPFMNTLFINESETRMKKLFKSRKGLNKEIILQATKAYIKSTDPKFIRRPHYFISKGVGIDKTEDLLNWIKTLKLESKSGEEPKNRLL